jgi:hypothetical protein
MKTEFLHVLGAEDRLPGQPTLKSAQPQGT